MHDFKKDLSETHIRVANILQEIERLHETDSDRGEHCLKVLNQEIDRFLPVFEFVKNRARQERCS